MEIEDKLEHLLELTSKLGLEIRFEHLGGTGGGLCQLKGKSIMFIDMDSEPVRRYETLLSAMVGFDIDSLYILPEIRDDIDELKSGK